MAETSTKPYMIRALYEWCCDNGYTPYLAVAVDAHTRVPRQHVKGGEIVLNVSPMATSRLSLGNELVEFQARFSGVAQQISIPIGNVSAIYARETGHGMAFDVSRTMAAAEGEETAAGAGTDEDEPGPHEGGEQDAGEDGRGGGGQRSSAPADAGERHASGSTVQSLRGGRRRGPRSVDEGDANADTAPARPSAGDGGIGAGSADASGGNDSVGGEVGEGRKEGAEGDASGGSAAGPRKRAAKGQGGADVIAFAPSGASAKKKGASSRTRVDEDGDGTSPESDGLGESDDEPPPDDGGGKGGKARLTRVK